MIDKIFIKERLVNGLMELERQKKVGGVLIKCIKTGNVFLLLRNDKKPTWALMSGSIDAGENVIDGLKREIHEELLINPSNIVFNFIRIEQIPSKNREFHYYEGFVKEEFKPILDEENLNYGWFPKDKLPAPLYPDLIDKIKDI